MLSSRLEGLFGMAPRQSFLEGARALMRTSTFCGFIIGSKNGSISSTIHHETVPSSKMFGRAPPHKLLSEQEPELGHAKEALRVVWASLLSLVLVTMNSKTPH
jgi:hypothetical protein